MGPGPKLSLLAVGAVALLVSAASASPHGVSKGGGELQLMWAIDPGSLDPALPGLPGSSTLVNATCAKLFRTEYDPDTGIARAVPEVAVGDPKITNGGRTYTFDLKRTFRFHSGERVTAQSFAYAFKRAVNPKLKSPVGSRGYLREIVGIEEAMKGTAETISGVRVLGPYRLQIRLTRRAGDFVARLTMPRLGRRLTARSPQARCPHQGHIASSSTPRTVRSSWSGIATTAVSAAPIPTASSGRSSPTRA
jgi:ABC-type oligopeptide transport system substrate-binding subunit